MYDHIYVGTFCCTEFIKYIMEQPKFIIQDGQLKMGRVELHFELAGKDKSNVVGGGYWYYDIDNHILYLYGESVDYGQVEVADFNNIWVRPSLEETTIYFSTEMKLEDAKKNNITIQEYGSN